MIASHIIEFRRRFVNIRQQISGINFPLIEILLHILLRYEKIREIEFWKCIFPSHFATQTNYDKLIVANQCYLRYDLTNDNIYIIIER